MKEKSIELNAIRFAANYLVVVIHLLILVGGRSSEGGREYLFWRWISQVLAPIAMPTLFFISGYLFYQGSDYVYKLRRRIGRLVVPYFMWNFLVGMLFVLLCIIGVSKAASADLSSLSEICKWMMRKTISLWSAPADMPTWYIRAIMVYCVLGPVWSFFMRGKYRAVRIIVLLTGISLFEYYLCKTECIEDYIFTYPPYSLLCFCAGGIVAYSGFGIDWLYGKYRLFYFSVGLGALIVSVSLSGLLLMSCWFKLFEVMILFSVAPELVKVFSWLPGWIRDSSFWLYVTHLPIFLFLSGFMSRLPFNSITARLIIGVSLMMIISIGSFVLLKKIFPRVALVLNGQLKI